MTAVFTVDTLLALFLTFTILAISLNIMADFKHSTDERMLIVSRDFLSVLEEQEVLNQLVDQQTTNYDYLRQAVVPQYCKDIQIQDSNDLLIYNNETCQNTKVQAYRSFSYKNKQYIAKIEVGLNG